MLIRCLHLSYVLMGVGLTWKGSPRVPGSVAGSSPDLRFGERLFLKLSLSVTPQLHGTDSRAWGEIREELGVREDTDPGLMEED